MFRFLIEKVEESQYLPSFLDSQKNNKINEAEHTSFSFISQSNLEQSLISRRKKELDK